MATKPVILTVDDDPEVLGAIERDLRSRYRKEYRIVKAGSGREALEATQRYAERGTPIALFVSDERMPEMTGTELLAQIRGLYPESRRVLLTAYSDTDAAIRGINDVGLDHYLLKPWDPPDQQLYPLLDDLLADWSSSVRLPYEGIRVAGAQWSATAFETKDFLARNHIPYEWVDVEQDAAMRELVEDVTGDASTLPVLFFPDGETLVTPSRTELAEKVGMKTQADLPFYDLVIVGAGPAGLAAAVYGGSEGLHTLVIEQAAPGGQAGTSSAIENYLGFPSGVSGGDLARRAADQAKRFGVELLSAVEVEEVRREDPYRVVRLSDGSEVSCKALILATGVAVRQLDTPGLEPFVGRGVYYGAAMTEAASYRDRHICIVGGANSAGQGALFFSRYAEKVTMLVRADSLTKSMSHYLIDRIEATPNIEICTGHQIAEISGDSEIESITLEDVATDEVSDLDAVAVFIFIGAAPRTEIADQLIETDDRGYVLTGPDLMHDGKKPKGWNLDRDPYLFETNVPGLFAVGDLRSGSSKRVAAAVGEGSGSVGMVHAYLENV